MGPCWLHLCASGFLRSSTFYAGGCTWSLRFYPRGYSTPDHVAVNLELMTNNAMVKASYDMSLVGDDNDGTSRGRYLAVEADTVEFDTRCVEGFSRAWSIPDFIGISDLEASLFIRGDRLVIECSLRVITVTRTLLVMEEPEAPQSELSEEIGRLLDDGEGADVTFDVQGERFRAHRNVLAVRTPATAIRAMLRQSLEEKNDGGMAHVTIDDMKPAVFDAVLHFIYTDRLRLRQAMDDLGNDVRVDMAHGLLAAADRFDLGRFKTLCEQMLSKSLEVETVAATLVLAHRYQCAGLRDACIDFMISCRMKDVARTEGYAVLKADHPYLLVEALEKAGKLGKI